VIFGVSIYYTCTVCIIIFSEYCLHCREACRDPNNFNGLVSSLIKSSDKLDPRQGQALAI